MPEWAAPMPFQAVVAVVAMVVEACGVATILLGVLVAFPGAVASALRRSEDGQERQRREAQPRGQERHPGAGRQRERTYFLRLWVGRYCFVDFSATVGVGKHETYGR